MTGAAHVPKQGWTAERFLTTDQHEFGDAWRYELVDGRIVAHAAPSPEHGAILAGLTGALVSRLRGNPDGCRPESGSGAVPRSAQRATARIPDALIRGGEDPRVMFEVISPSEPRHWTERDARRGDHAFADMPEPGGGEASAED
jgi:Uma2 family endonuclease